jgi:hypothetical protein
MPTLNMRPCLNLDDYETDRLGTVYRVRRRGSPITPFPLTVTLVGYNRKVSVGRKMVSVARLVLEAWVGPANGRRAMRLPSWYEDGKWPHPDAPENMHWSAPAATDDLTVYLSTPTGRYNFEKGWVWPVAPGYTPVKKPDGTYRSVPLPREQYTLRGLYEKISHPQLTEVNQAPMLMIPLQE